MKVLLRKEKSPFYSRRVKLENIEDPTQLQELDRKARVKGWRLDAFSLSGEKEVQIEGKRSPEVDRKASTYGSRRAVGSTPRQELASIPQTSEKSATPVQEEDPFESVKGILDSDTLEYLRKLKEGGE